MTTDICHQSLLIKLKKTPNLLDSIKCVKTKMTFVPPLIRQEIFRNEYKKLFPSYQHNAHFLYSITIYMLHYNPQHVSSSTLLIFRRTNCIITASGIVTVCTVCRLRADCRAVRSQPAYSTESDDTRGCNNTICPPEDEQGAARNKLRTIM